jgi:hypothetical protein
MYERYWRLLAVAMFISLQPANGTVRAEQNPYTPMTCSKTARLAC